MKLNNFLYLFSLQKEKLRKSNNISEFKRVETYFKLNRCSLKFSFERVGGVPQVH